MSLLVETHQPPLYRCYRSCNCSSSGATLSLEIDVRDREEYQCWARNKVTLLRIKLIVG